MIAKALGLLDLMSVIAFLASGWLPHSWLMSLAMVLFAKGFIFAMMGNSISFVDAAAGIYMGLIGYGLSNHIITVFFCIFLGQKGLLSLLAR